MNRIHTKVHKNWQHHVRNGTGSSKAGKKHGEQYEASEGKG